MPLSKHTRTQGKSRTRIVDTGALTVDIESASGVPGLDQVPSYFSDLLKQHIAKELKLNHLRNLVQGWKKGESGVKGYSPNYARIKNLKAIIRGKRYTPRSPKDYILSGDFHNSLVNEVRITDDAVISSVVVGRNRRYNSNITNKRLARILNNEHDMRKSANSVIDKRYNKIKRMIKSAMQKASNA